MYIAGMERFGTGFWERGSKAEIRNESREVKTQISTEENDEKQSLFALFGQQFSVPLLLLVANKRLYKPVCLSVGPSVRRSVRP